MIYYEIVLYFVTNSTEIMTKEMEGMCTFDTIQLITAKKTLKLNDISHPYYYE